MKIEHKVWDKWERTIVVQVSMHLQSSEGVSSLFACNYVSVCSLWAHKSVKKPKHKYKKNKSKQQNKNKEIFKEQMRISFLIPLFEISLSGTQISWLFQRLICNFVSFVFENKKGKCVLIIDHGYIERNYRERFQIEVEDFAQREN